MAPLQHLVVVLGLIGLVLLVAPMVLREAPPERWAQDGAVRVGAQP